jgi:dGTPase
MIPNEVHRILGPTRRERLDTLVADVIRQSEGKPQICQSPDVARGMAILRGFMFERVYEGSVAKMEADKAKRLLMELFHYYVGHVDELIGDSGESGAASDPVRIAVDYIAGMTDRYAMKQWTHRFVPAQWTVY